MAVPDGPASDAIAQTLNYALGNLGGRQKSWMQAANPSAHLTPAELTADPLSFTPRKSGRPRNHPLPPPSARPETARLSIEPHAETHPPSNSTSPQLANTVACQNNASRPISDIHTFPSPSPSEESAPAPALGAANLDFLEISADHADYAPQTPLETVSDDDARRVSSGAKRPSASAGAEAPKRLRQEQPPVQAGATHSPQTVFPQPPHPEFARRPSTPQGHILSPQLPQLHSRSPSLGHVHNGHVPSPQLLPSLPTPAASVVSHDNIMSPHRQGTFGTAAGTDPSLHSVPVQDLHLDPQLLQMTRPVELQPDWYTQQECLDILNGFLATFVVSPQHHRDGRRIAVLKEATEKQDWQYLLMHQFYCLLESNRNVLPLNLLNLPGLPHALRVMQDVFDSNDKLSPAVLRFFSRYPYHVDKIRARWPVGFQDQTRKFWSFVAHAKNYEQLKLAWERRRFPPIAWELARYLGLESATFQRLLFTASLRIIWRAVPSSAQQSHYEARAVSVFKLTQVSYSQRLANQGDRRYLEPGQVLEENKADLQYWGALLKHVFTDYEVAMRGQGYPVATPFTSMPPHVQQQQAHHPQVTQPMQRGRGRGRPLSQVVAYDHILPPQVPPHQPPHQGQQYQPQPFPRTQQHQQPPNQGQRKPTPLLPPSGWVQPQQRQPNPARFSLHQAYLQSPVLHAQLPESPLYHFMQGFIKEPTRLTTAHEAVERWSFDLDAAIAQHIPPLMPTTHTGADRRAVNPESKTVRIRCIKWLGTEPPDEHTWATADTSWIPYSYFTLNGTSLQQRKKVHHGKDLPIDVTGLVREGRNLLEMTVMARTTDTFYKDYLVAIEYLGVISQASVRRQCQGLSRIPLEKVVADIKRKLDSTSADDEVAIVQSNLTITLFDPFSASKICDTPVRSRVCPHNDCFDLDTFLETRRREGDTSVTDQWRCPICNLDARPHLLCVDGFLEEVKKVLDAQGRSNTRAITVQQDGSWAPKAEVRDPNGVSDATSEPPTPVVANAAVPARSSIPANAEIIDLSD